MGRIKKAATERHLSTLSPFVRNFVKQSTEVPLHQLPSHLESFPQSWPLPRGDLYHWIPLLDRFDHILDLFNSEYALNEGPQTQPFERRLLRKGDAEDGMPYPATNQDEVALEALGYSDEGDRELIESILHFTRILLEHCGNRSLYASSTQINNLLHTTSLSLLRLCLKLSLRLAQRYQVARYKNHNASAQAVLLANHYNINFDNLNKIAAPFPKPYNAGPALGQTPSKVRDKAAAVAAFNPSDLVAVAKAPLPAGVRNDLSQVSLSYYDQTAMPGRPATANAGETFPASPTPTRTSNLGPSRPSAGDRSVSTNDISSTPLRSRELDSTPSTAPKQFHISASKVAETPAWALLKDALPNVPADMRYELLNRVRIAKVFASQEYTGQQLLEIRLLAISNLAYAYNESKFQEKIGIPDSEEPRRFHLAQQLCDLLQPATNGQSPLSLQSETAVILALDALTKSRNKVSEVGDALAISVNHGVLYFELRKVIASLNGEEHADKRVELQETEWRDATFDLINSLLQTSAQARYGEKMIAAGIMSILVESLSLRTSRAERFQEKVLQFFDSFIHGIPISFQTLANIKGLDIIADLTAYGVNAALENARSGNGLPKEYKSKVVDYDIPFHQQSTLRQCFKNTVHMFEHNAGTHDRLLRNLIDTPQILGALRNVIENAQIFGSNVWSGAVNIVSSFIHNEPTSYQVIGEAGLSKSLLESITGQMIPDTLPALDDSVPSTASEEFGVAANGEPEYPTVSGILPVGEVMCDIPTAFGAICLNETGMQLFQASGALTRYFDVFLSPRHVRAIEEDAHAAATIGQSFDELSRHQPRLKPQINAAVINMLKRLRQLCVILAKNNSTGVKLWERKDSKLSVAGGRAALTGTSSAHYDEVLAGQRNIMSAADSEPVHDDGSEDEKERAPSVPFLSACIKFLDGFFHNSGMCQLFCEESGAELLLDLATSPAIPYDIVAFPLFSKLTPVLKAMCEARPHLVLPSIIRRIQFTMLGLQELTNVNGPKSSFASFAALSDSAEAPSTTTANGTTLLKSLVNVHLLTHILGRMLAPPSYALRHGNQQNHLFTSMDFTEIYVQFIDQLGKLHASCIWEGLILTKDIAESLNAMSDPQPYKIRRVDGNGVVELAGDKSSDSGSSAQDVNDATKDRAALLAQKNLRAIRYLLSQVPVGIESLFHSLGQAIVTRRLDTVAKQHAMYVADRLAQTLIAELEFRPKNVSDDVLETRYTANVLAMMSRVLLRNSISMDALGHKEALTLVLSKFYLAGGFKRLNEHLDRLIQLLAKQQEGEAVEIHVKEGVQAVLNFYGHIVRSKCITEASQTSYLMIREPTQPDYFQAGQFLVEIRDAVLPAVSKIWHSQNVEKLTDAGMRSVVDILRLVLKAEGEDRAIRRSENTSRRVVAGPPEFKLRLTRPDELTRLTDTLHFPEDLSREALYRCNHNSAQAEGYCRLRLKDPNVPRFPIPDGEPAAVADSTQVDSAPASQGPSTVQMDLSDGARVVFSSDHDENDDEDMDMGSLGSLPANLRPGDLSAMVDARALEALRHSLPSKDTQQSFTTLEDLDEKRAALRDDLIDRCLDVLSSQPNITFELADLIQAAVAKAGEGANPRAEIGGTLVSSLMSLQASEESSREAGLKIHAYAHLLALILQDRDFFDSTLDELKDAFENLVSWVKLEPDQKAEDAPWVEMVLLIIERVLAEDEQPIQIEWHPPPIDDALKPALEVSAPELVVTQDLRSTLFDALVDLLPKIGKNRSLALSVCRVLVVLTRRGDLASRFGDKHTMGRLFLMIRQLAGSVDDKIQASFMLILRQLIEDDDTIRQIMKAEIRMTFDNHRSSRAMDTTSYTRNMYYLALRNPQIFIEVTQEMLEISRFDGNPNRAQSLALKRDSAAPNNSETKDDDKGAAETENVDSGGAKPSEPKPPISESADGVIQFLLRELSNWRDVEDKPTALAKESSEDKSDGPAPADIDMPDASTTMGTTVSADSGSKNKPVFKPEEHAAYIYRCFILQCLAEILSSYNRTKVDFINFSRKPDSQPSTPLKPRAGTLNYLLNVLLPVGTLEHRDDIAHRKKVATSSWAAGVLVALCTKTQERHLQSIQAFESASLIEQEPELTFVRKFVLEHALRSFKEATASQEPLDQRYSRLLALGDLFNRMLQEKVDLQRSNAISTGNQIGRFMYEKSFIPTLTSAIAELDLNFPNAKRAVKYILNPLKQLTELGVKISQTSDSSSTGAGTSADEEDDFSSSTSMSEDEQDEREQTPNMYRDSSLGMFEAGGQEDDDEESDEEEDDDEMYDDGYDDEEMDYEEEQMHDHGDVVSDEDEDDEAGEMGGMGDIEGVPGDIEIEVDMMDEDDDDDSDPDDDDDEDSDDDQDIDPGMDQIMDEITGDDENASLADHDEEGDWEEDDGLGYDDGGEPLHDGGSPHGGPLEHIAHVLGAEDPSDAGEGEGIVRIDMGNGEEEYFEDEMAPEDDEDEEFAEDIVYEPEMEDEEDDEADGGWAWEAQPMGGAPAILRNGHMHHHHHHHRGFNEMLGMIGGDGLRSHGHFRTHRSAPNNRDDDGVNPLLQRDNVNNGIPRDSQGLEMPGRLFGRRANFPRHDILQDLVAAVGAPGGGPGVININVDPGAVPGLSALPPMFIPGHAHGGPAAMIDIDPRRPWRDVPGRWADTFLGARFSGNDRYSGANDEAQAVEFRAVSTAVRWQEAARMLFPGKFQEKATRVINTLLQKLVPLAMEAKRVRDKELEEAAQRLEAQRAEERRKAEEEAKEKKEREEQEAREREAAEAEARARQEAERAAQAQSEVAETTNMEGVQQEIETTTDVQAESAQTEEAATERVTVNIRGRELDITSLGIDREYIEALPEDMREEVIMAQVAEQRSQQVESGANPSEISREFLEALPREIQQELLRSEQMERRRRERDEARRRAVQEGTVQLPEDMNNADFMATLDPGTRDQILLDVDPSVLAALPEEIQAQARALQGDRRLPRANPASHLARGLEGGTRIFNPPGGVRPPHAGREPSRQRRPIAQMLDKPGIATLLRLMFVSLNHKAKINLHGVLSDVCKNVRNRSEVISILLAILQDGTADVSAVERSFAHLSLRAKQAPGPQTPQPLKRSLTGQPGVTTSTELSPLNIVQQCLGTLNALSNDNPRVKSFFLNEHETVTSHQLKSAKKGKGKESRAVKFPINALLTLLDRKLITENTAVMETLASLLSNVTRPLTMLLKRAKEAQEAESAVAEAKRNPDTSDNTDATNRPQTSTSDVPMLEVVEVAESTGENAELLLTAAETPAEEGKESDTIAQPKKKQSDLVPPEVPDENMRLIVNILAARECPSKTFSDTLDIIKNMSAIPGAKEVFGRELIRQAQDLGQVLLADLEDLAKQINAARTGTDLQGMALASFSSAGAKQKRMLRVLVALDHVFDPKRTPTVSTSACPDTGVDQKLKEDILATLHESPTFDKLWKSLSVCLTAIRERGDMVNVATILLPLIESLMVVCRNSALKETAAATAHENSGTPAPDARMETLFFNFTEEHRKILNELIRNNPKLMNGNLAVLAKNSKVLEFDNKRNYFARKLHDRRSEVRMVHPSLQLSIRRDQVFLDSFKSLYYKNGNEIKYGKLNIRFHGEEGVDAGGVSREWFAAMARQMFNPDYALFNPVASDRTTFHPNTLSGINHEHLMFFKFIGRIIGKALYENRVLDCHFTRAVYRKILGKSVSLKDMETLDLDYYKSLVWMLENDITDVAFETFSVEVDRFGLTETIDLIPNGREIAVTEENKNEYVRLVVEHRLIKSVQEQLDNFLEGFHEIIPAELIAIFNEQELELLISGLPDIDVDDWKNNTEYHNYQPTSPQIQWFWRAVRSFDKEEKAKLLQFVTGTSKVPLNGFKELEGMNGFAKFNIHRDYSSKEKLPSSHTCFNQLDLPEYESYEHLRQQLYTAITAGSEYFGFA